MTQHDLDLTITKISNRNRGAGGSWVQGKINDEYRFDALVFAEHAEHESFELNQSKISKLPVPIDKPTPLAADQNQLAGNEPSTAPQADRQARRRNRS